MGSTNSSVTPHGHFGLACAAGLVAGVEGRNYSFAKQTIPALTEVVCVEGATVALSAYPFLSNAGEDITPVSTSIADIAVALTVFGLGADGTERVEVVALTGTTPVTSSGWRRVNIIENLGAVPLVGDVTVARASDASPLFAVRAASQRSFCGVKTIPVGKRAAILRLINSMQKNGGSNTATIVRVYTRTPPQTYFALQFATIMQRDGDGSPDFDSPMPELLPELTDIAVTVESETAGSAAFIRSSWAYLDAAAYD